MNEGSGSREIFDFLLFVRLDSVFVAVLLYVRFVKIGWKSEAQGEGVNGCIYLYQDDGLKSRANSVSSHTIHHRFIYDSMRAS